MGKRRYPKPYKGSFSESQKETENLIWKQNNVQSTPKTGARQLRESLPTPERESEQVP